MENIRNIIKSENIDTEAISLRRYLHQNPELSEKEFKTMELICSKLQKLKSHTGKMLQVQALWAL